MVGNAIIFADILGSQHEQTLLRVNRNSPPVVGDQWPTNAAAKKILRLGISLVGVLISPCRPCLNRCGRRVFGKGYQMVNVYDPNPDELEAADTNEKLLAVDRDTEV